MMVCCDRNGGRLDVGDLVRRVGKLRTGGARALEEVLRRTQDGTHVYLETKGGGVRVREWVSTRLVERAPDVEEVRGAMGG